MKNQEMDVENVGIMQGMADGMDELIEKHQDLQPHARQPQSPS